VFQPVINGVGGNLVAVQASRISTSLHRDSCLGKLPHYASSVCLNPYSVFCTQGKTESPVFDLMYWFSYHNICGTAVNTSKFLWNHSRVICVLCGCKNIMGVFKMSTFIKEIVVFILVKNKRLLLIIQGGARNVIPLIVHVTHFYYYKNI